jgi:hypothetical protein
METSETKTSNPESTGKKKNSGRSHASMAGVTPITVGDPTRASSLAIDQSHLDEILTDGGAQSSVVLCRRPPKGHFFTVLPETGTTWKNRRIFFFLEIEGHDPYIVDPQIAKAKIEAEEEDCIRPVLLVRYVTMQGEEGLWPLKLDRGEKVNAWNVSARNILQIAESGKWVRIMSLKGHYQHQVSRKSSEDVPPKFTKRTFDELVDAVFADRIAGSDHEIWTQLKDGSTK